PKLIEVPSNQKTDLGDVIYANSITLTPGTITIRIRDGVILVHALSEEAAEELLEGEMGRRVRACEGDA
ncbi:Na+/H+ antiporter subunit E, partial [Planctomycetaceae bacterium]|nr:Na+/H+ antiporter subunit E [Planctomycetaceae bacterium]